MIIRALLAWIGLLFGWCIVCKNASTCALEILTGVLSTNQRTSSLHGGVVSEPLKR